MDIMSYYSAEVNKALADSVQGENRLHEAMRYALLSGGKRIRPVLMLAVLDAYGYPWKQYISVALSIEYIHTYSLIHDDLPAMDDDALRRGKPTTHIAFDEATAILAGDALLTDAFSLISEDTVLSAHEKVQLIQILATRAGSKGMVYGQVLDLHYEGASVTQAVLESIHHHKTAKLIEAPLMMASVIANERDIKVWESIGKTLGLAFQIQDDVLEVISDEKMMGKSLSDVRNEKSTYVRLLGIKEARLKVDEMFSKVKSLVRGLDVNVDVIDGIVESVKKRLN